MRTQSQVSPMLTAVFLLTSCCMNTEAFVRSPAAPRMRGGGSGWYQTWAAQHSSSLMTLYKRAMLAYRPPLWHAPCKTQHRSKFTALPKTSRIRLARGSNSSKTIPAIHSHIHHAFSPAVGVSPLRLHRWHPHAQCWHHCLRTPSHLLALIYPILLSVCTPH